MKAAVLYGKEDLRVEDAPAPPLQPGEARIAIEAALTCGTDLKVFRRGYHAKMIVPPAVFGHELSGVLSEVGPAAAPWQAGDRVVAANSAPCGTCFYCKHGQENLCDDLLFNNGAYAEYIRIPKRIVEKNTLVIPDKVSFEEAAMVEPLACVLLGLNESNVRAGDNVVIIGGGPIGLMFIQVAKAKNCRVISVVKRDEQVQIARQFGADEVVQILPGPTSSQSDTIAAIR